MGRVQRIENSYIRLVKGKRERERGSQSVNMSCHNNVAESPNIVIMMMMCLLVVRYHMS